MEAVVRTQIELFRQNSNFLTIRTRARKRVFYLGTPQMFVLKVRLILDSPFAPPRKDQSTAPRRAAHLEHTNTPRIAFFPCARLCAAFLGSSTPHRTTCPLLCFAPLPSRWTLFLKVRVAVRIMIVVVHVGRRLRSLVQLLTLLSGISWKIPVSGAKPCISSGSLLCKEWALFNLAPAFKASR